MKVMTKLPQKQRQVVYLLQSGSQSAIQEEWNALRDQEDPSYIDAVSDLEKSKASDRPEDHKRLMVHLGRMVRKQSGELSQCRHQTAISKLPSSIEYLKDVLSNGHKVVVFAYHRDIVNALSEALAEHNPVVVCGSTTVARRQAAMDTFQKYDRCKVLIGSIDHSGVGLTLTAASRVIFVELDWVPEKMIQAEDQCHRKGQANSVLVQHLVLEGSVDARIAELMVSKQKVVENSMPARRSSTLSGKLLIATFQTNPRRRGSQGWKSYQILLDHPDGILFSDFVEAGGRSKDFHWDHHRGKCRILDPD